MKATKALKRLAKIDSLMTDVAERFKGSPQIREALQDTRAALARIKTAMSSQASAEKASKARSKQTQELPNRKLIAAGKVAVQEGVEAIGNADEKTKVIPARKKAAAKTMAAKTPAAMTAKKRAPIKRAPIEPAPIKKDAKKNATLIKAAQAPVEIPAIVETDPATLETATPTIETAPVAVENTPVTVETTRSTVETDLADVEVPEVEVQSESVAQVSAGN